MLKQNYARATAIYKELTEHSEFIDGYIKQDILDYLIELKRSLHSNGAALDISAKSKGFPQIFCKPSAKFSSAVLSESHRVEQMIRDALHELGYDSHISHVRMPLIADAYKRLDARHREKLAPLYERLVYKLRDLKR